MLCWGTQLKKREKSSSIPSTLPISSQNTPNTFIQSYHPDDGPIFDTQTSEPAPIQHSPTPPQSPLPIAPPILPLPLRRSSRIPQ